MLLVLPNELIILICELLHKEGDINAMAKTSCKLYIVLNRILYIRNAQVSRCSALTWAISTQNYSTAQQAIGALAPALERKESEAIAPAISFQAHQIFVKAARSGSAEIVQMMVRTGLIDVNWWDPDSRRTALGWASMCRHSTVVRILIESHGIALDSSDCYGQTPLCLAAQAGDLPTVKMLLYTGKVDANRSSGSELRSPLSWATANGNLDVIRELVKQKNINLESRDRRGRTPLMVACQQGHADAANLLLDTGLVSVNARDRFWNRTSLIWASILGRDAIVAALLSAENIDAEAADIHGNTALSVAVHASSTATVKLLLDSGKADLLAVNLVYDQPHTSRSHFTRKAVFSYLPRARALPSLSKQLY